MAVSDKHTSPGKRLHKGIDSESVTDTSDMMVGWCLSSGTNTIQLDLLLIMHIQNDPNTNTHTNTNTVVGAYYGISGLNQLS